MNFCYSVVCWDLGDTHTEVPQLVLHTKPEGEAENPRLPSPQPPLPPHPGEHRVIPKPAESYNLVSESWVCHGASFWYDMPKTPQSEASVRYPSQTPRPPELPPLERGGFTRRLFQMTELLTPESPATL